MKIYEPIIVDGATCLGTFNATGQDILAARFIRDNGLISEFLMADGSVSTGPYDNYLSWTLQAKNSADGTIGSSNITKQDTFSLKEGTNITLVWENDQITINASATVGTPNLQQVTDTGSITTRSITTGGLRVDTGLRSAIDWRVGHSVDAQLGRDPTGIDYANILYANSKTFGASKQWACGMRPNTNDYFIYNDANNTTAFRIQSLTGNTTIRGSVTAASIIKLGGLGTQYLMADGTITTGVTLATQEEGVIVNASNAVLNFIGAGVTATIGGSGITNITIPGGGEGGGATYDISSTGTNNTTNNLFNIILLEDAATKTTLTLVQPTGLEALDEGSGIGFRLLGRDPLKHADIGEGAIDMTYSPFASSVIGASGYRSAVFGGEKNYASGVYATITGGNNNTISGNSGFIGCGSGNLITGNNSGVIGGGVGNIISSLNYAFIGGGAGNDIKATASHGATIGGGYQNTINNSYNTIVGGYQNTTSGESSTVVGGYQNISSGWGSIAGGVGNSAESVGEVALGFYGTLVTGNSGSMVPTDRVFNIGVGANAGNRSDGFTIFKNGAILLKSVATPTNPEEGMIYFDSTSKKLRCYDGTIWNDLF